MPGKSFALVAAVCGFMVAGLAGCPSNIKGRTNSGKDYRVKGAKKVSPDGKARWRSGKDIVTYPGGDRIDWKYIELPEGTPLGTLTIKMKFDVPRPKIDVAFNVFDQYNKRIARAKPSKGSKLREREMKANTKQVKIKNAKAGKYYVQIYAPRRTDAGRYRITAKYTPTKVASVAGPGATDIPDPPKLAAVPEAEEPPPPPDPNAPVPCATDPTKFEPNCPVIEEAKPIRAKIIDYTVSARSGIIIVLDKGSRAGVQKKWSGVIVDSSGEPVEDGEFTVFHVTSKKAKGKVKLSVDQIKANRRVIISPQ